MFIDTRNEFEFALAARSAEFIHESNDRVVASIVVKNEVIPVCLYRPDQQFHMDIHPPFRIKGDATWKAYEDFAQRPETAFNFWIDPFDGEVKYCDRLVAATAEDLDRVIQHGIACLEQEWETLARYQELSDREEDKPSESESRSGRKGLLELLRDSMMDEDD